MDHYLLRAEQAHVQDFPTGGGAKIGLMVRFVQRQIYSEFLINHIQSDMFHSQP